MAAILCPYGVHGRQVLVKQSAHVPGANDAFSVTVWKWIMWACAVARDVSVVHTSSFCFFACEIISCFLSLLYAAPAIGSSPLAQPTESPPTTSTIPVQIPSFPTVDVE